MLTVRSRYVFLPGVVAFALLLLLFLRGHIPSIHRNDPGPELKPHPIYKPARTDVPDPTPLPEYFPLAAAAKSPADLPPVPSWNTPPNPHVPEKTRLYIGFTRYWPLLQQVVVSYITAGWPPEDIYVVENTGTFDANRRGLLTPANPFYLDIHRLTKIFGVNVITTPSLQTFAQLQNFYLSEAVNNGLQYYFWGHMDVVVQTHEDTNPYKSLYEIAVDTIRESMEPGYGVDEATGEKKQWAIRFFSYDWLALVNADSFQKVGGWDSMIGYYGTDCDMHTRLAMNGFTTPIADAGKVFDVGRSLDDLEVLYRRRKRGWRHAEKGPEEEHLIGRDLSMGDSEGSIAARKIEYVGDESKTSTVLVQVGEHPSTATSAAAADSSSSPDSSFDSSGVSSGSEYNDYETKPPSQEDDERASSSSFTHLTSPDSLTSSSSDRTPSGVNADYFKTSELDDRGSDAWRDLQVTLEAMAQEKRDDVFRNSWQLRQRGGQGEPYYYDADGWEKALQMTVDMGLKIMDEKWGHKGCEIQAAGLKEGDQWKVEHDWD